MNNRNMFFLEKHKYVEHCNKAAKNLYDQLKFNSELSTIVDFEAYEHDLCFHVKFKKPIVINNGDKDIYWLSIAYPYDICGNGGPINDDPDIPTTIEIVLINKKQHLCYIKEEGYNNIKRFEMVDDLIKEILYISRIVC